MPHYGTMVMGKYIQLVIYLLSLKGHLVALFYIQYCHYSEPENVTLVEGEQAERRSADHVARYPLAERVTEERGIARGWLTICV